MSEKQKEYIKNNEFNIKVGGRGIIQQKIYKLQQENAYYKYILTEFENWLEEHSKQQTNNMFFGGVTKGYEFALNKLQELKEGKK